MLEKKEGQGEDADPLFFNNGKLAAVGVFDGMGGSGAMVVDSDTGPHTSAYVASRKTREFALKYLNKITENEYPDFSSEDFIDGLKSELKGQVEKYSAEKKSLLRSSIIRDYPTTLSIITVSLENGIYTVSSYWAGDSRNYIMLPKTGLMMLSKDDIIDDLDPFENLTKDSPLSNCVCTDRPFRINELKIKDKGPFIVFSATDGCFGYFQTPMHFENALLQALNESKSYQEWEQHTKDRIKEVAADDISLSMAIIGYSSIEQIKADFKHRRKDIQTIVKDLQRKKEGIIDAEKAYERAVKDSWNKYKRSLLNNDLYSAR